MGNESPPEIQDTVVGEVQESRVFAIDEATGGWVGLATDEGILKTTTETTEGSALTDALESVATDELRIVVFDSSGTQIDPATQALEAALKTNDTDEFVSRLTDSAGTEVDPATQALEGALEANAADEFRVSLYGVDDAGNSAEVQAEDVGTALGGTETAVITYLARALDSQGLDEFVSRVTDSTGTQIDPLTQDPTTAANNTELRSQAVGLDAADTPVLAHAEQLDTALAATDEGLLTWVARALNTIGQDELVSRITDATGVQIDPLNQDALQTVANDELRSRIHDSAGAQIDPATQALEAALKTNDTDEFVSRVVGADGVEVQEVALDTAAVATDTALLTHLSRALNSQALDEMVSRLTDSTGAQIDPARKATHDTVYTSIDLNTAATTLVYDPATEAEVDGIHLNHGGATAELRLEVTDGTNTAVLQDSAAGDPIHYPDPLHLNADDSLQVVVEVVEGAALTETASVSREEY